MASAEFEISIAGGGYADSPQDGSGGDAVILRLKSVTGVSGGIRWRCIGTHDSSVTIASIQALMDAGLGGTPYGQTCSFTLPAGTGQGYLIECTVNGGIDANGVAQSALVQNGIVGVLNSQGVAPVVLNETFERDPTHGVVGRINTALNTAGGGGLSAPANPADDGKVAIASGGDLSYSLLANANVATSAAIAVTKLASGTANQIVKTNSGGTALEHGLIANANIDTAAAMAVTKLANGTANQFLRTNSGGTAAEWATVTLATLPADPADDNKIAIGSSGNLAYSAATLDGTELDLVARDLSTTGDIFAANATFTAVLTGVDADFSGDVTAASLDTSNGTAPTGAEVGLVNEGAIRWAGFASGYADVYLDSLDRLVHENVDGDQFQLAPSREGSIAVYENSVDGAVNTTDATPTEVCRLRMPPNYQGAILVTVVGHQNGSEATNSLLSNGTSAIGVISDATTATVTIEGADSAATGPKLQGNASSDSWVVSVSTSGLDVIVSVTGGAYTVKWTCSMASRLRAN